MMSKLFSLLIVFIIVFSCSFFAFADETTIYSSSISEPTFYTLIDVTQSDVAQGDFIQSNDTLREELDHLNKHHDFYTTVIALLLVVLVIVALWLLFGRWFFRY